MAFSLAFAAFLLGGIRRGLVIGRCHFAGRGRGGASRGRSGGGRSALIEGVEHLAKRRLKPAVCAPYL